MKKFERDDLPKLDWLDNLAFRKMEEVRAVRIIVPELNALSKLQSRRQLTSNFFSLGRDREVREPVLIHRPTEVRLPRHIQRARESHRLSYIHPRGT